MLTTTWDAFWLPGSLWHWCVSFSPVYYRAQAARYARAVCGLAIADHYTRHMDGLPTNPYAIIHRNGAGCQILYLASQRRVPQVERFEADKPRRANALGIRTPRLRCAASQNTTRRRSSVGWFGGSHRAGDG
jgi:hypothetical protein